MKKFILSVSVILLLILSGYSSAAEASVISSGDQTYFDEITGLTYYIDQTGEFYYYDDISGEKIYVEALDDNSSSEMAEEQSTAEGSDNYRFKVIEVLYDDSQNIDGINSRIQTLYVEVLTGPYKGRHIPMTYDISDTMNNGQGADPAEPGDILIGFITQDKFGNLQGVTTMFGRDRYLIWLGIFFFISLILIGGKRGIRSILALLIICLGCIFVMIPAIINGMSPVLAAILVCVFAIIVTLIIVHGFTKKSIAAAIGAVSGVLVAGILVMIMNSLMHMTGITGEESMNLALAGDSIINEINLRGMLFAAIVISILGGTIDVGISIASSLDELHKKAPDLTGAELMTSGISIGVDIMGASLNTLILAFIGGALHLLLLFSIYNFQTVMILNDELIVSELLRAMAGSIGLLFTVPITSFVASIMMCKGKFGKLTPDCFASIVTIKKAIKWISQKKSSLADKISKRDEQPPEPENLYEAAVRHHGEQDVADDTEGPCQDTDCHD